MSHLYSGKESLINALRNTYAMNTYKVHIGKKIVLFSISTKKSKCKKLVSPEDKKKYFALSTFTENAFQLIRATTPPIQRR